MKVLVTGFAGQLGHDVAAELAERGISCIAADKADFDLTNRESVKGFVTACKAIKSASITAVSVILRIFLFINILLIRKLNKLTLN